ncbi:hypothetical protein BD309DRAFT_459769 [Dichomitus squalens]|nr:hypothetical protein BD309DRAFT_459769 [Dichomitus squalens]
MASKLFRRSLMLVCHTWTCPPLNFSWLSMTSLLCNCHYGPRWHCLPMPTSSIPPLLTQSRGASWHSRDYSTIYTKHARNLTLQLSHTVTFPPTCPASCYICLLAPIRCDSP